MSVNGAQWVSCTPGWVHRYNACGETIRQVHWDGPQPMGHEHLMARGCPVLWQDAVDGQLDRLQTEAGEQLALAEEDPF